MIANITKGDDFLGVLDYALAERKDPVVIATNVAGGEVDGRTAARMAAVFEAARRTRPKLKNAVWHCSLSLPKGESESDGRWCRIAESFMREMGFRAGHQYAAVRHADGACDHVHVIVCRVAMDGSVWSDSHDFKRAGKACAKLEERYGMTIVPRDGRAGKRLPSADLMRQAEREGVEPDMTAIQREIDFHMERVRDGSVPDDAVTFIERLSELGISARLALGEDGGVSGISFGLGNTALSGGDLGADYVWPSLLRRGLAYSPEDDPPRLRTLLGIVPMPREIVKGRIDRVLAGGRIRVPDFIRRMGEEGVAVSPLGGRGMPRGFRFLHAGVSFSQSDFGKGYGMKELGEKGLVPAGDPAGAPPAEVPGTAAGGAAEEDAEFRVPDFRALGAAAAGDGSRLPALKSALFLAIRHAVRGGRLTLPRFMDVMKGMGVQVTPNIHSTGNIAGLSFAAGGASVKASSVSRELGWSGLRKRWVDYDAGMRQEVIDRMAAPSAAPRRTGPSPEAAGPPAGGPVPGPEPAGGGPEPGPPAASVRGGVSPAEALRRSLSRVLDGKRLMALPEFMDVMEAEGARVVPTLQSTGNISGISFVVDGTRIAASSLGKGWGWKGLQGRGLVYDRRWDAGELMRRMDAVPAGSGDAPSVWTSLKRGAARAAGRIRDLVRTLVDRVLGRKTPQPLPEFIDNMGGEGASVEPVLLDSGEVARIFYRVGEDRLDESEVGEDYGWPGLVRKGVVYDAARDRAAVEERASGCGGGERPGLGDEGGIGAGAFPARGDGGDSRKPERRHAVARSAPARGGEAPRQLRGGGGQDRAGVGGPPDGGRGEAGGARGVPAEEEGRLYPGLHPQVRDPFRAGRGRWDGGGAGREGACGMSAGEEFPPGRSEVWEAGRFRCSGYESETAGGITWYRCRGGGGPAFADAGPFISVFGNAPDGGAAALRLARDKWGGARIAGGTGFLERCGRQAELLGVEVWKTPEVRAGTAAGGGRPGDVKPPAPPAGRGPGSGQGPPRAPRGPVRWQVPPDDEPRGPRPR